MSEKNYYNLKMGEKISFTQAKIDARYASEFQDLSVENGPYHDYGIVDFPDGGYGFNAMTPLYYVQLKDIL